MYYKQYSDAICVRIMDSFTKNLRTTYDWSIDRMNELCTDGDMNNLKMLFLYVRNLQVVNKREDKSVNHDIVSLEYMGEGTSMIYNLY